jgi:phospholipid-binding lipoprotein MlaA
MYKFKKLLHYLLFALTAFLAGCACVDPLEPLNRQIFAFNMVLDRTLFRPIARAYDKAVPPVIACHIGNFFDNIDDVTNVANNLLQFKLLDAWSDAWRVAFNTTFGFLGFFDVATCAGLPKHHQDFGLTLARYGFVNSTYLMVPFFGPSTIRDTIGWAVDWRYLSVWPYIEPTYLRYGLYGLRLVHKRAALLPADQLIDDALDPYVFVRDAYLQKRECDIKSICPPCETPDKNSPQDNDDTFVSETSDGKSDSNDPFISDEAENKSDSQDPFVAEQGSKKSDNNDPFVSESGKDKGQDKNDPLASKEPVRKEKVNKNRKASIPAGGDPFEAP